MTTRQDMILKALLRLLLILAAAVLRNQPDNEQLATAIEHGEDLLTEPWRGTDPQ